MGARSGGPWATPAPGGAEGKFARTKIPIAVAAAATMAALIGSTGWNINNGFDSKVKRAYEALRVRPGAASILVIAFFAATNRLTSAWQRSRAARASAIWAGLPSALAPSNWAIAALERIKSDHIPFNKVSCRRQQTVACILLAFAMSGHIPSRHWLISVNLWLLRNTVTESLQRTRRNMLRHMGIYTAMRGSAVAELVTRLRGQ
jgi:hypothetical protein